MSESLYRCGRAGKLVPSIRRPHRGSTGAAGLAEELATGAARLGVGTPVGRARRPEEVASAILWLLGPRASYTTGAVSDVAGGR